MTLDKVSGMPPSGNFKQLYHTSPMREGVLCWYPFTPGSSALDLSGGALTDLLERHCAIVKNFEAPVEKKVDYIAVLDPEDFSVEYLKGLRARLNPNGRLLLAYENPFALRFWAGKKAPNTERPYDTLFERGDSPLPSKAEMQIRLGLAGFGGQKWYYPLTDHWLTTEVYSDSFLPNEYLNQRFVPYIADDGFLQFDERSLYREVIRGGAFEFMCGAYLVEARNCSEDKASPVDYAAVTAYREPAKRFATTVRNDGTVHKAPLHPDGLEVLQRIHRNHDDLEKLGLDIVPMRIEGGTLVMPRLYFPTLWDYWVGKLSHGILDENEMISHFDRIRSSIIKASANGKCYGELVPANCFFDEKNDRIIFFDQEFYWENYSPDIALARALYSFHYSPVFHDDPRTEERLEHLKERYGLSAKWEELINLVDGEMHKSVFGWQHEQYREMSNQAGGMISERYAAVARYIRFYQVPKKLCEIGVKNFCVYGFGKRGKSLRDVFEDWGISGVTFIDQKFQNYPTLENSLADGGYDAIIVSIFRGEEVVAWLRGKTQVPVYMLDELLG